MNMTFLNRNFSNPLPRCLFVCLFFFLMLSKGPTVLMMLFLVPMYTISVQKTIRSTSQIEGCSGRSTQVPFWRKWVIDGFEVVMGQKIFWQNFGQFDPFPVGVTQRSSRGQKFKMFEMTFHVYQITCEVIRTTKIYSLLCVGCMAREILMKGHPKVKWDQIFNNIRFAWMTYQIIPLS